MPNAKHLPVAHYFCFDKSKLRVYTNPCQESINFRLSLLLHNNQFFLTNT